MRRRVAVVAAVLAAVGLAALGATAWRLLDRQSPLERAVGYLPPATLRVTWTDWAQVRAEARAPAAATPPRRAVDAFLDRAFDTDLVGGSAVADSTHPLAHRYGFSPLRAAWEVLGQAESGQVAILGFPDSVELAGVERRLRALGYDAPPDGPGTGGTWRGSADLVARIDPLLTPIEQNVAVLPEEGLVLLSDAPEPVDEARAVVAGEADGLAEAVGPLLEVAGSPAVATLWAGDFACRDLAMSAADEEDQRLAERLVARVGGVSPLAGLVVAQAPGGRITVGMRFQSEERAAADLQPRVDLAAGEAPGQGGSFADRFRVVSGQTSGEVVVLELAPRADGIGMVFSDITSGPVLFATC